MKREAAIKIALLAMAEKIKSLEWDANMKELYDAYYLKAESAYRERAQLREATEVLVGLIPSEKPKNA